MVIKAGPLCGPGSNGIDSAEESSQEDSASDNDNGKKRNTGYVIKKKMRYVTKKIQIKGKKMKTMYKRKKEVNENGKTVPQWMTKLKKNLEAFLEDARNMEKKREDFYNACESWLYINKEAINSIKEIRDKIVGNNQVDNCISVGASAAGTLGSVLGIIGGLAALPTGGASLLLAGVMLGGSGAVVSIGSNLRRSNINKSLFKMAVENLKINEEATVTFDEECKSYFEALDKFNSFFDIISGNDVALALFYEAADTENFSFLADLKLDRWSRSKVRTALAEIIEADVTKLKPRMWCAEFLKSNKFQQGEESKKLKSLGNKIRKIIHELIRIIENNYYLSCIFRNTFGTFLISKSNEIKIPTAIGKAISSAIEMGAVMGLLSASALYLNIKSYLQNTASVTRAGLLALNALFVVIGIVGIAIASINLENGSQSEESKNITKAVDNLEEIREKVIDVLGGILGEDFKSLADL